MRCLASLYRSAEAAECEISICLVDDGSSDQTVPVVREAYPQVRILSGDGSLYWAGGMRYGWEQVLKAQHPDLLLVFNNDIEVREDAVGRMLETSRHLEQRGISAYAIAGAFQDPTSGKTTYGAVKRIVNWKDFSFVKLDPGPDMQEADTLNMNMALISGDALKRTDFLNPRFRHSKADFDFGFRLKKSGGLVVLAPGVMGVCPRNSKKGTSAEPGVSVWQRVRRILDIKEHPLPETIRYYKQYAGPFWPLHLIRKYRRRIFGHGGR
jgi:GT2 family glycosyltransferase